MSCKRTILVLALFVVLFCVTLGCVTSGMSTDNTDSVEQLEDEKGLTVVGFSQPGAESDWRVAHTESVKGAFTEENGYKLIYKDAQSKLENQIKDVRTFIQQGVDIIILSPMVETGWDSVLEEAKQAGIPVLITDRLVAVEDDSLYVAYIGSDFYAEGEKAINLVETYLRSDDYLSKIKPDIDEDTLEEVVSTYITGDSFDIVHIRGTEGSTAEKGRGNALMAAVEEHEDWNIVAQVNGEFNKAKAYEAMKDVLNNPDIDASTIDMVYCDNDNEAYGVIDALKEKGITYGVRGDIIIVSFDGSRAALQMCMNGEINFIIECNPNQGPELITIRNALKSGGYFKKMSYIKEDYFMQDKLNQIVIDSREY